MEYHVNILLLIGIAVFIGLNGGKIFQRLKIPQVVGYIIIGVLLGDSVLGLFKKDIIEVLTPINSFALGLIGFMIGGELKKDIFDKYGSKFITILLFEGIITFLFVTTAVSFFTGKVYLGILFGALASATAPAATVDVLWEYKSKGVLTTTILAIVALDDGLALILYGFSVAFAKTLITGGEFSLYASIVAPTVEIAIALSLGLCVGYFLYRIVLNIYEKEHLLVLAIGAILVNVGLASVFELDLILSSMTMGVLLANLPSQAGKAVFDTVKGFTPPIYVLFFVLVGARLQIWLLPQMGMLGLIYLLMRSAGKLTGSYVGAVVSKAEDVVKRYLGMTLFSQAGVAIGLAIAIYQSFSKLGPEGQEVGMLIINVIAATTFVVQVIGPPCVKFGILKAKEIGKDITEEDILNTYKVEQIMEKDVDIIFSNEKLSDVISIVRDSNHIYLPVIDKKSKGFIGVISFQNIKDAIFEGGLGELMIAGEVATYEVITSCRDERLISAMDKFMYVNLNFLPVVESEKDNTFVGILHKRTVAKMLKQEMIGKLVESHREEDIKREIRSGIHISELMDVKTITLDLQSDNKNDIIREMACLIAKVGNISDPDGFLELFLERESQTTTGIGNSIAIPHARTDMVKRPYIAFGRINDGVDFMALDRKPVHLVFMVAAPLNYSTNPMKIMGLLSRLLIIEDLRKMLNSAETPQSVIDIVREFEERLEAQHKPNSVNRNISSY